MSLLDTSDMRDLCVDRQPELKLGGSSCDRPYELGHCGQQGTAVAISVVQASGESERGCMRGGAME